MSISDLNEHDATCVRRLVEKALEEGYQLTLTDQMETVVNRATAADPILEQVGDTDLNWLYLYRLGEQKVEKVGMFFLVYGNGPGETINDHSDKEECYMLYDYANEPWKDEG